MEADSSGSAAQEGWLLIRVNVPELNVQKNLQFPKDQLVWDVKQQCLAALPKELKESFNYGLFCPPINGKAGKFLDEERRLGDYPFNGPVGYLELKYKRRVYKMLKLDEKQLKAVHTRANLRRFIDYVGHGQVEKITKMCAKGLDPNFHCQETGETPLTMASAIKKPSKILIALVNGGALLDYRTRDGSTAMHRAVEKDSLEAVKTLLELGASPNYKDGKGLTPLYLSVTNKTDPLLCETLLHDHGTIGAQDLQGWQEVHQACRNGLVQHLEHLVAYGADLEARNASGNSPLHVCAVNAQRGAARLLLFRGASKDALNFAGQTPYQVAVIAGDLELAECIHAYRPDDVVPHRGPPRYNPRRRSGASLSAGGSWSGGFPGDRSSVASALARIPGEPAFAPSLSPSPGPFERSFSDASSSLSDGSHPDDSASILTDKSLGEASDAVSDSSGVGTSNSEATNCSASVSLPGGATVVCLTAYAAPADGHLRIRQGDIIQVTGASDCGLLEGQIRGSNVSGLFPPSCVHEVRLRHAGAVPVLPVSSAPSGLTGPPGPPGPPGPHAPPGASPRVAGRREIATKNYSATAPRLKKTNRALECRTVVLHRGRRGFGFVLRGAKATSPLMELQPSERCPGLQYLDDVDRGGAADTAGLKKGDFLIAINGEDVSQASHERAVELIRSSGALVSMSVASGGAAGGAAAGAGVPASRSAASLAGAGAAGAGAQPPAAVARPFATLPRKGARSPAPAPPRRDPRTALSVGRARAKSALAGLENGEGEWPSVECLRRPADASQSETDGAPAAPQTASIRARPASSRITAAELEDLFQRQQGHNRGSAMMTTSAFQDGCAGSPPYSPAKGKRGKVYASVAEMKRSKGKTWSRDLRQRSGELRRRFHSTPDLALEAEAAARALPWAASLPRRAHRSHEALAELWRPPPLHPPPPPPLAAAPPPAAAPPMSSFRPADSAKLYAAPRPDAPVAYRAKADPGPPVRKSQSLRINNTANTLPRQMSVGESSPRPEDQRSAQPQYAQPFKSSRNGPYLPRQNSCPGPPPIPEPDYSMSESEDETGNPTKPVRQTLAETSANSNASGSSSGSGSMHHSFSVEEIRNIKTRLKSSKSYPNDFAARDEERDEDAHDDGDNSSSGVSSDQELNNRSGDAPARARGAGAQETAPAEPPRAREKVSFSSNVTVKSSNDVITTEPVQLHSSSESVSGGGEGRAAAAAQLQRHNSLTRRQAAACLLRREPRGAGGRSAAERLGVTRAPPGPLARAAVSLARLPPPPEEPALGVADAPPLAPPPQFSDRSSVRIVGAVPKAAAGRL